MLVLLLAASLALLGWLTLHWGILPRLESWRPAIEQRASAALGQPVRVGRIAVRSQSWVPSFELQDVRLLDAEGRTALQLGRVTASLAARSLLAWELRFAQLHVERVDLDVRRDARGRIRIAGFDTQDSEGAGNDDGRAADWLFSQQEVVVRQARVRWTDEWRAAPPLELRDADLVLRNSLRRHQLRLDASPPAEWGERFTLIGQFTQGLLQRRGDWRQWSGTAYALLPAGDVAQLRRYVNLPVDVAGGRGALRAWLDLERGQWRGATVDLALADVAVRLAPHLEPIAIAQLAGRVSAARSAAGGELLTRGLRFTTGEGVDWLGGDLVLEWQQQAGAPADAASAPGTLLAGISGGRLRAERIDLGVVGTLAARLPLGRALETTLQSLSPAGQLSDLDLRWSGAPDAPTGWQAKGRVARLVLAPRPSAQPGGIGRPGIAGADIDFELGHAGGKATLAMKQGALHFPGIFEDSALAMDELQGKLEWKLQSRPAAPPMIELRVQDVRFANADARGDLKGSWRTGKGSGFAAGGYLPGEIDIAGHIQRAQAARVAAYLPMAIPASVRHYVARAVRAGEIDNGSFAVKGDAWHVPFADRPEGTFRISGRLRDGAFDYLPSVPRGAAEPAWESPWPGFTQVSGDLLFDRASMTLDKMQARLWGVQLRDVTARIASLTHGAVLKVDGEGRGPVGDMLRFVEVTPVGQWIGGGLKTLQAAGPGELRLGLSIPLEKAEATQVAGSVTLGGNDLQIRPDMPVLAGARGRVDFSHKGFQIVGATARALGGEVSIDGGLQPDGSLRFNAQGMATAEGLRRAVEFTPLPLAASALRGQASWRAQLLVQQGRPELTVTSDLVGLASDWPAPLDKPAAVAWPMRWQSQPVASARAGDALRDQLRLDLGPVLQLRLLREWQGEQARLLTGALGLGENAPTLGATAGALQVRARLPRLELEPWQRAWSRLPDGAESGVPGLPRLQVQAQVQELLVGGRRFTGASLDLTQDGSGMEAGWQAQLRADQAAGRVSWRPPRGAADGGRVQARLDRLVLPPAPMQELDRLPDTGPSRLPALDIVVEDFELGGRKLGRLELQASGRAPGLSRDWKLDRLELVSPEARLTGQGLWSAPDRAGASGRMQADLALALTDTGRLASRLGWIDAIRGGEGRMTGRLAWNGSPLSPDWPSLDGQIQIALEQGQFLRAEPGVGRLLGVLSLQSLPRRLLLDFRDVFQQGFAFDQVTGDIQVARGRARTDNLRMRGVQASVLIEGSADLVRETQDLRVLIVPEINAGAASLAYVAINPAVGLGTFLAQLLLRDPLRAANTREFTITGPLSDPKVDRVERAFNAPLPGSPSSAPPAAASPQPAAPRAVPSSNPERPG